jgi:ElaB/YqjD/DUF883 family membrane-anchored ribosome-binding protein
MARFKRLKVLQTLVGTGIVPLYYNKDSTIVKTDHLKVQTADALEEAARKLRNVDISEKVDDVRKILQDVESRMNRFRDEAGIEFEKIEAEYHKKVEPVENIITAHPIPSVLIAAGIGVLIGALISRGRD